MKVLTLTKEQVISPHEVVQENRYSMELTNPPVVEAKTCLQAGYQTSNVQFPMPRITSVFSQAVPIQVNFIVNKHDGHVLVENNQLPKKNNVESTQHASTVLPPANKKVKLPTAQVNAPCRTTLARLRSVPVKSAVQKVDLWLKGFDPQFGTISQWLSYPKGEYMVFHY